MVLATEACKRLGWQYVVISETQVIASTGFSFKSFGEKISLLVEDGRMVCRSECANGEWINSGRNKKNIEHKFFPEFTWLKSEFEPGQLDEAAGNLQRETLIEQEEFTDRVERGNLTAIEKISIGTGGHYATYSIIAINLLVFILMAIFGVHIFDPTGEDVITWGGNIEAYTAGGQPWRLMTCVFIHVGVLHLLFNMYGLYVIGRYLEPLLGKWKFTIAYLCTGVFASIFSIMLNDTRVSAGASGAIFGMFGFFLALLTTNYIQKQARTAMLQGISIFIGYSLLSGMRDGVDNAAHVGGLISGLIIGYAYYFFHLKVGIAGKASFVSAAVATCTVAVAFIYVLAVKDDNLKFQQTVFALGEMEQRAVGQINRLQYYGDDNKAACVLQDSTLPTWNRFKLMIDETNGYKLNPAMQKKRQLLKQYAELRLYQTELVYNALLDHTGIDAEKLQYVMGKLETISASLK